MTPEQNSVNEAAWELLDRMKEAEGASGLDEKRYAMWDVEEAREHLEKMLNQMEEEG